MGQLLLSGLEWAEAIALSFIAGLLWLLVFGAITSWLYDKDRSVFWLFMSFKDVVLRDLAALRKRFSAKSHGRVPPDLKNASMNEFTYRPGWPTVDGTLVIDLGAPFQTNRAFWPQWAIYTFRDDRTPSRFDPLKVYEIRTPMGTDIPECNIAIAMQREFEIHGLYYVKHETLRDYLKTFVRNSGPYIALAKKVFDGDEKLYVCHVVRVTDNSGPAYQQHMKEIAPVPLYQLRPYCTLNGAEEVRRWKSAPAHKYFPYFNVKGKWNKKSENT